jgi:hypothetical protein
VTTNSIPSNSALRRRVSAAATVLVTAGALAGIAFGPAAPANAIPNCGNAPCPPPGTTAPRPTGPPPVQQYDAIAVAGDIQHNAPSGNALFDGVFGYANNQPNQAAANSAAVSMCQSYSDGAQPCQVVIGDDDPNGGLNQCVALGIFTAADNGLGPTYNAAMGSTLQLAEANARFGGYSLAVSRCPSGSAGFTAPQVRQRHFPVNAGQELLPH